jgi:hypothetical protein
VRSSERGAGLSLITSLRLRVTLATALTFVGLGVLVCLVLPRAYAEQAREGLRERTRILANGVAHQLQHDEVVGGHTGDPAHRLRRVAGWLDSEPDFDSALLMDPDGRKLAVWPASAQDWSGDIAAETKLGRGRTHYVAVAPVSSGTIGSVAVRTSTTRVAGDLENMRWLFVSIFVVACMSFWVLSRYLVHGIVDPLEEVRRAAMSLADGERHVPVPASGDREIDELGRYIDALGRKRRHSTLLPNPLLDYLRERSPLPKTRQGEDPGQG